MSNILSSSTESNLMKISDELDELEQFLPGIKATILKNVASELTTSQRVIWKKLFKDTAPDEVSWEEVFSFFRAIGMKCFAEKHQSKSKYPVLLEIYRDLNYCTSPVELLEKYSKLEENFRHVILRQIEFNRHKILIVLYHVQALCTVKLEEQGDFDNESRQRVKDKFQRIEKKLLSVTASPPNKS